MRFFAVPQAAEQAGFRACKRCRPQDKTVADPRLDAVRRACRVIETAGSAVMAASRRWPGLAVKPVSVLITCNACSRRWSASRRANTGKPCR